MTLRILAKHEWQPVVTAFGEANRGRPARVDACFDGRYRCLAAELPLRSLRWDGQATGLDIHVGNHTVELRRHVPSPVLVHIECDVGHSTLSLFAHDGSSIRIAVRSSGSMDLGPGDPRRTANRRAGVDRHPSSAPLALRRGSA